MIGPEGKLSAGFDLTEMTNREGRWVLPVRSGKQHSFEGIIHASSQSKQTVFMEPKEIIPLNNRPARSKWISRKRSNVYSCTERIFKRQLDDFDAIAKNFCSNPTCALPKRNWRSAMQPRAAFLTKMKFDLIDFKHPLLLLANVESIPNSVHLDQERRILLLTGPNAGGKTVLLKSVGLAAQMSRCGFLIAAERGLKLPFFETFACGRWRFTECRPTSLHFRRAFTDLECRDPVARPATLLLIDEIAGSTDPEEGTALARGSSKSTPVTGALAWSLHTWAR